MARSPNRHKRPASEEPQTSSTHPDQTRPRPRRRRLDHSDFELPVPGHNFAVVIDPPRRKQESRADAPTGRAPRGPTRERRKPASELEVLRRRRAGEDVGPTMDASSSDDEGEEAVRTSLRSDVRDQNDASFVVDDDDGDENDDEGACIPVRLTRLANKPPEASFEDIVEWVIHTHVNPGVSGGKETFFRLAFAKLDGEVATLASSQCVSSAWRRDFVRALCGRPTMVTGPIDEAAVPADERTKCEACGRTGHMPQCVVRFEGEPYYPDTLEDVAPNEAGESLDHDGRVIPSQDKQWMVARVCHENAQAAHDLKHWMYRMNAYIKEVIVAELGDVNDEPYQGTAARSTTAAATAQEERRKREERRAKTAERIFKRMVRQGEVYRLYRILADKKDEVEKMCGTRNRRGGPRIGLGRE